VCKYQQLNCLSVVDSLSSIKMLNRGNALLGLLLSLIVTKARLTILSDMITPRFGHGACLLDQELYVLGGQTKDRAAC